MAKFDYGLYWDGWTKKLVNWAKAIASYVLTWSVICAVYITGNIVLLAYLITHWSK